MRRYVPVAGRRDGGRGVEFVLLLCRRRVYVPSGWVKTKMKLR